MKPRKPVLEISLTAALALLFGFLLAAGSTLNGGGYLGYGVEGSAAEVFINWQSAEIYLSSLLYALPCCAVLMLLWRALDWIAAKRVKRLERARDMQMYDDTDDAQMGNTAASAAGPIVIKKRWFWLAALALICCWLPFWLALWPGIFNYDGYYQYEMLTQSSLQTHHPLVHTFLLDGLILFGEHILGSANTGLALYIGLGLIVTAFTFAWLLFTMAEEGAGKGLLIGSFLFFAVNPALVIWLISTNKDVLFTDFLLLAALLLYRVCRLKPWERAEDHFCHLEPCGEPDFSEKVSTREGSLATLAMPEKGSETTEANNAYDSREGTPQKTWLCFKVAFALFWLVIAVLAFRTSGVYSFIVFLPFAALLIRKHVRLRLVGIMTAATTVFIVLYLVLVHAVFQIPSGPWQTLDALSIPRQQLARVWVEANLTIGSSLTGETHAASESISATKSNAAAESNAASESNHATDSLLTTDSNDAQASRIIAAFEQVFSDEDLTELSNYEADNADTSRKAFRTAFYEKPFKLLALYLEMGFHYPGTYTDAALLTSYEAWYPGAVIDGYVLKGNFSKPGEARGCYIDVSAFPPAEETWILPGFGEWLKAFGLGNIGMDNASLRLLCSPATYLWLLLIVFVRTLCVRNRRGALVCTLLLVFGLTALLSPLVVMRYYLMVMAATPLLVHIASSPSWRIKTETGQLPTSEIV